MASASAPAVTTPSASACCPRCQTEQRKFYCSTCLSHRIHAHSSDVSRVGALRDAARAKAQAILGPDADAMEATEDLRSISRPGAYLLADPFGAPPSSAASHASTHPAKSSPASHAARNLRARKDRLSTLIGEYSEAAQDLKQTLVARRAEMARRRVAIMQRRQMLVKARRLCRAEGDEDDGEALAPAGAWPKARAPEKEASLTSPAVKKAEQDITHLESVSERVGEQLARTRVILAQEALRIFAVEPPASSAGRDPRHAHRKGEASSPRSQRSRERYVPGAMVSGAFDLRRQSTSNDVDASAATANDWTIVGLVLPLPSELRRFPRDVVNGAVSHTAHLIRLLAAYLGLQLPFSVAMEGGSFSIRANELWSGVPSLNEDLYLSTTAYISLNAAPAHSTGFAGSLGASAMNLGASTLSTIESFVQLPGGNHFSWGRASVLHAGGNQEGASGRTTAPSSAGSSTEDRAATAARSFCTALVMLSYDIAFMAHVAGVKLDLISAAGSPLRLLSRAVYSAGLGRRAHLDWIAKSHIRELHFAELDFAQLSQIHSSGSGSAAASGSSVSARVSSSRRASQEKEKQQQQSKGSATVKVSSMDESYVDAGVAAAEPQRRRTSAGGPSPVRDSTPRPSHAASLRGPGAAPSSRVKADSTAKPSLDFLKVSKTPRRSSSGITAVSSAATPASKPSSAPRSVSSGVKPSRVSPTPPTPAIAGGVIFNGAEVVGAAFDAKHERSSKRKEDEAGGGERRGKSRSAVAGKQNASSTQDDEWHVV